MTADDRADQIRARLAAAKLVNDGTATAWSELEYEAPADLAFLLAERDELLRRVEQAERAGAVKALRNATKSAWKVAHKTRAMGVSALLARADAIENGADL